MVKARPIKGRTESVRIGADAMKKVRKIAKKENRTVRNVVEQFLSGMRAPEDYEPSSSRRKW